jgi:hypothetical protein
MADVETEATGFGGVLRITWVADDLAHILQHSQTDETTGTWTGLACPDHGLEIGADVDNARLRRLAHEEIPDLIWKAPPEFPLEHARLCLAAVTAYQAGEHEPQGSCGSNSGACGPAHGPRTTRRCGSCRTQA